MAKEATNSKPSMQLQWYCLKNSRKHTLEYVGGKNRLLESPISSVFFLSHTKLLAYQLKQLLSYFTHRMTTL